jgi:UDP-arabinose 4-epimerase
LIPTSEFQIDWRGGAISLTDSNEHIVPSVLIAGGAGYIGGHTAKALHRAGFLPLVLDNLCTGDPTAKRFGPFFCGSITDSALITDIVSTHRPVAAMLFAGHAYVGESTENPRKYFRNNVADTIHFLDTLTDCDLKNIVFSSSCSVYGNPRVLPLREECETVPLSPYGETKLFAERVLRWYGNAYGLRSVSLRYFNAAGADPEGELGENHDPETHIIPLAIRSARTGTPLQIFGTDYDTPDGTAIRDFTHVSDLADGHVKALRHLLDGGESSIINLGTGSGNSILQVIQAVEAYTGLQIPAEYRPRREGDAAVLVADTSRAQAMLGWSPRYSSLSTIVQTACDWANKLRESPGSDSIANGLPSLVQPSSS